MSQYVIQPIKNDMRRTKFNSIDFDSYFKEYDIKLSSTLSSFFNVDTEHYHLLAYLSKLQDDIKIIDTGTHRGGSALAFSYNQSNDVYTYDIEPFKGGIENNVANIPSNISYDAFNDITQLIKTNPDHVLESSIFFLDINHEGPEEMEVINFLKKNQYKGMLILDDIHLNPQMKQLWTYVCKHMPVTYDVSKLGHVEKDGGTGIVFFESKTKFERHIKKLLDLK